MTIETFIQHLSEYQGTNVFNPWRDYDAQCDIGPQAPAVRRRQLHDYLQYRLAKASYAAASPALPLPANACCSMHTNRSTAAWYWVMTAHAPVVRTACT